MLELQSTDSVNLAELELKRRINEGSLDLPMLPKVAGLVLALTQDESSDMGQLSNLIQSDQALATRILKIANSPAYRPVTTITSLNQAVARMGMSQITEMALAASIGTKIFKVKGYEDIIQNLWQHSMASGSWGKEIARSLRRNVESAFMCGLLCHIGKPVVLQAVTDIEQSAEIQLNREEVLMLLDRYHAVIGENLAKNWNLPPVIGETILYLEAYKKAPNYALEAMITKGAVLFANHLLFSNQFPAEKMYESDVLADLNLYSDNIDALLDKKDSVSNIVESLTI